MRNPEIIEISKNVRSVLRRAFPKIKMSVTSHSDIMVRWTADEPNVEQVKQALLAANAAELSDNPYHRGVLKACGYSFWFVHNTTAKQAEEQEKQRKHKEEQERIEVRVATVKREYAAGRIGPIKLELSPPTQDKSVFEAFEKLRLRAETDVASEEERTRRPTWAPPLILGAEFAEACYVAGLIGDDDKWIGRLWAMFATPKRSGRYLREHVSNLPLLGLSCRGFQFFAGPERGDVSDLLFEAQREESGEWRFGPRMRISEYWNPNRWKWDPLVYRREQYREWAANEPQNAKVHQKQIDACTHEIDALDAENRKKAQAHNERQSQRARLLKLARKRVLDFIGAPDAQMAAAGRLWGHCCICGRELADPISVERGIGPECLQGRVQGIRVLAGDGHPVEEIAAIVGMPIAFINEVLTEVKHGERAARI